jgi:hypothetical protein
MALLLKQSWCDSESVYHLIPTQCVFRSGGISVVVQAIDQILALESLLCKDLYKPRVWSELCTVSWLLL